MHLLMETAIGDSQQYEVLSFEEADQLKKELAVVTSRIEATKRKLALENKVHDAATSLNRLHSSNSRERVESSNSSQARNRKDSELAASDRKCDELSQELWRLEKRCQEVQSRLLEHTAGILQMTHKGFLEEDSPRKEDGAVNGHLEGFDDMGILGHGFDDRSFYQTLDTMLEAGGDHGGASAYAQQTQSILETERKLWDLNSRLRDAITQASSGRSMIPAPPDPESSSQQNPDEALQHQLSYLENGTEKIKRSQLETLQNYKKSAHATEEKLEDLSHQVREVVLRSSLEESPQYPSPPDVSGRGPGGQIAFLEAGLGILGQHAQQQKEAHHTLSTRSIAHEEKAGKYENMIQRLWMDIGAGERFSVDSFSSKVTSLNTRMAGLQEQKDILSRQIQQQRELNSKPDDEKDRRLAELTTELENTKGQVQQHQARLEQVQTQHEQIQAQHEQARGQLEQVNSQHEQVRGQLEQSQNQLAASEEVKGEILAKMQAKSAESDKARKEMKDFEGETVRLQTELTVARAELDGAYGTRAQRAAEVAQHPVLQEQISSLTERNTFLEQELATTKAQHEAAGSGNVELTQRVQTLQKELAETIGEYEVMTKSSIEFEKERENLENTIDGLRDRIETLETQLSDEKVRMLGQKSPGVAGDRSSNEKGVTSTSVLKNEFKKMMRETRAENMRALMVSCCVFTILVRRC